MKERIVLSDRLKAIAAMVTVGNRVCDVGCDHAYVPVYLINQGISPYVLAMDVGEGPLERAREHIREYGLEAYIDTRLSDGLKSYEAGEADTLICAGMGGRLMINILEAGGAKTSSFKELILQPQSELQQFRYFLRMQGYMIEKENMIEEDGKFYPIVKAVINGNKTLTQGDSFAEDWHIQMEDRYGPLLIQSRHPALGRYIRWEMGIYEEILSKLRVQDMSRQDIKNRYEELESKFNDCIKVLQEIS